MSSPLCFGARTAHSDATLDMITCGFRSERNYDTLCDTLTQLLYLCGQEDTSRSTTWPEDTSRSTPWPEDTSRLTPWPEDTSLSTPCPEVRLLAKDGQ